MVHPNQNINIWRLKVGKPKLLKFILKPFSRGFHHYPQSGLISRPAHATDLVTIVQLCNMKYLVAVKCNKCTLETTYTALVNSRVKAVSSTDC